MDYRDTYLFNCSDYNEPMLRMVLDYKGKLDNGEITTQAFDEMCSAFDLDKIRTSKSGIEVYRSKMDLRGYFDYYPDAFTKKCE